MKHYSGSVKTINLSTVHAEDRPVNAEVREIDKNNPSSPGKRDNYAMFTCFPKLPIELRLKIFKEALSDIDPRIIEITSKRVRTPHPVYTWVSQFIDTWSLKPLDNAPSLFFACREARSEAVKVYHPIRNLLPNSMAIYWDPSKDALAFTYERFHLNCDDFFQHASSKFLSSIRHIIFDTRLLRSQWSHRGILGSCQAGFAPLTKLETLGFAIDDEDTKDNIIGFVERPEPKWSQEEVNKAVKKVTQALTKLQHEDQKRVAPKMRVGKFVTA